MHGLSFDRKGKIAVISANPERFSGEIWGLPDPGFGLILGELALMNGSNFSRERM